MTKRGRIPKPTALHKTEGTYQPCRDPARQKGKAPAAPLPELPAGAPPCPSDLSVEARKVWHDVVPALQEIGTLAKTDGGVLALYCSMLTRARKLEALAEKDPVGKAAAESRKLSVVVERLATDLGLHYAARARAGGPAPGGASSEEKQRIAETEAFLFETAPFTVVQGGKA